MMSELLQDTESHMSEPENENENESINSSVMHVMYCGPNLPSKGIFSYQVYIGGLPVNVKEMIQEVPEIERLIVPVRDADEMRAKIRRKGTAENLWYERVKGKVIK